ncbi:MAG: SPOR domain-containing protein, partial [Prevotellaceae bacterium]|nr:SPOR domain-containing protein [Prevotellaceae bacterium]
LFRSYSLNGTISFSPATDTFESPEYYGLDTFCMHPTLQTTTTPKPYVELHIPHAFLRNSVAVVLAIAFFFMVSTPVERMPVEQSGQATLAPTALVDKVTKESLLTKPVVPTVKPENEISNRENVTPVRKKYHLIVGSLATQADGEKMVGDLQNDGHRAHLITVDGKFRACIASYATRTEALEQLAAYRDKAATSNAWVLVKSLELPAGL